jgi:hypothetical protein
VLSFMRARKSSSVSVLTRETRTMQAAESLTSKGLALGSDTQPQFSAEISLANLRNYCKLLHVKGKLVCNVGIIITNQ